MSAKTVLPPPPGCLWLPQAADRLGVKPRTLHTWRQRRKGPASFRHAGRVVYRETALAEYLAECEAADSHSNRALDPTSRKPELDIAIPDRPKRRRTAAAA